jgi:hypothetical protein
MCSRRKDSRSTAHGISVHENSQGWHRMHGVGHVSHNELQQERGDRRIAIDDGDKRASRVKRGYFSEYI